MSAAAPSTPIVTPQDCSTQDCSTQDCSTQDCSTQDCSTQDCSTQVRDVPAYHMPVPYMVRLPRYQQDVSKQATNSATQNDPGCPYSLATGRRHEDDRPQAEGEPSVARRYLRTSG